MEHRTMDWHSWLSKSCLEPSLVYDYGLLFMNNELEEDDIAHFDHDFLQSMGVSIAKHRLEILKLAKNSRRASPLPVAKLATVIRKSKTRLAKYIRTLARSDGPAILVVPKTACGDCWRGATSRRKTKLVILKQGRLMITDRGMRIADLPSRSHSGTPMGRSRRENSNAAAADGCWETADGATRWDSMFQNLKPT
ncbi:uncharacterized protein LOC135608965 [Musa acuminata AAA Group]|uniref:(wild Malaysian banana) hypothetical protein n=1 Tax=Musa acuminata subsp. malaccensis TaxID=214687 RepID=A0A804IMT8_MUSAM|nr:PREDICTED: uncharacterized protein LOC103981005 [Musa acuminata subsp. malaccensis]CAG1841664.1 unnamed protein product [Musa acuminata subsp. malaccensis]